MVKPMSLLFISFIILSCSSDNGRTNIIKGQKHTLRCPYYLKKCYFKAQNKCARSYRVINQHYTEKTGGPYGRYKEYVVYVECT